MKILFADDTELHRSYFKKSLDDACKAKGIEYQLLDVAEDGKQLVEMYLKHHSSGVDVIFSDIRMPNMDGLSALVKIHELNPEQDVIMVSSESADRLKTLNVAQGNADTGDIEWGKKINLLEKVADRVKNNIVEPGKVNLILDGCEKLAADPVLVAKHFKAKGYLQKPYDVEKVSSVLEQFFNKETFATALAK